MFGFQTQAERSFPQPKFRSVPRAIYIRSISSLHSVYNDLISVGFFEAPEDTKALFPGTEIECDVHSFCKQNDLDVAILFPREDSLDKCLISIFDHKCAPERELLFRFDHDGIIDGEDHLGKCYFPLGTSASPWDCNGSLQIRDFQIRIIENRAQVFVNGNVSVDLLR
jgi:hypothetical protein